MDLSEPGGLSSFLSAKSADTQAPTSPTKCFDISWLWIWQPSRWVPLLAWPLLPHQLEQGGRRPLVVSSAPAPGWPTSQATTYRMRKLFSPMFPHFSSTVYFLPRCLRFWTCDCLSHCPLLSLFFNVPPTFGANGRSQHLRSLGSVPPALNVQTLVTKGSEQPLHGLACHPGSSKTALKVLQTSNFIPPVHRKENRIDLPCLTRQPCGRLVPAIEMARCLLAQLGHGFPQVLMDPCSTCWITCYWMLLKTG